MSLAVIRTSHSETVKSAMDFSTAICDASGEMVGQGVTLPNQLGAIPDAVESIFRTFPNDLEPGDIITLNDPFAGGTHLPDIYVIAPVFFEGRMIALIATVAHHADLGGSVAGSMAPDSYECYQEGLRIPPVKLYLRGKPNPAVHALIRANCRIPDVVLGDFAAQVVACRTGEAGFLKLVEAYGLEALLQHLRDLLDYTDRLTRAEIRSLPDGVYEYTDYIDDDGFRPESIPIKVKITIRDDEIEADFDGTSPQLPVPLNSTLSFTKSCVYYSLRTIMRTEIPHNAGFFRAITVKAPRGSILNCVLPAATATRGLTGFRVSDAVFGALAKALPERIMGASDGGLTLVGVAGRRERGEPFTVLELVSGAWGGRSDRDGVEGVPNLGANISNIPVEMLEAAYPVRIEQYGFVPDTGGAGKFRGGLSLVRDYRMLQEGVLTVRADRQKIMPYGVAGGQPGTPSANVLNPEGDVEKLPSKFGRRVRKGDLFRHVTAGAGGWGNWLERDPAAVARDVRNGKLSAEYALREYSVVLTPDLEVDEAATLERRRCST
jgi:N-methylhydantoinase B